MLTTLLLAAGLAASTAFSLPPSHLPHATESTGLAPIGPTAPVAPLFNFTPATPPGPMGLAAPVVASDGSVLVGSPTGALYKLGAKSGAPLWTFAADGAIGSVWDSGSGIVAAGTGTGAVGVASASGKQLWVYKDGYTTRSGGALFPVPSAPDVVILAGRGNVGGAGLLAALHASTGILLWRQETVDTSTFVVTSGPLVMVASPASIGQIAGVTAYDAATGAIAWSAVFANETFYMLTYAIAASSGDGVLMGTFDGQFASFGLLGPAGPVWRVDHVETSTFDAVTDSSNLYLSTQYTVTAYAQGSGKVVWTVTGAGHGTAPGPLVLLSPLSLLLLPIQSSSIGILALATSNGAPVWMYSRPVLAISTPTVDAAGVLYITSFSFDTGTTMAALDPISGSELWSVLLDPYVAAYVKRSRVVVGNHAAYTGNGTFVYGVGHV